MTLRYLAILPLLLLLPVRIHAATPDKSGVKPSTISLPSGPGSIEGLGESFEPQLNSGTFTYGVGISLPAGRAGLAPSVHLSYNSGLGNGMAGIGWELDTSTIRRQTDKGFPGYTNVDTFIYSGEELVPLGNPDGDYRCENEAGFSRFRRVDSDGDQEFDSWEMTDRNGVRYRFGRYRGEGNRWSAVTHPAPPAAATSAFDRTYLWALDQTEDLHGNRIEYEYEQPGLDGVSSGVLYPSRIRWSIAGDNWHEVRFEFEARPDIFDDYRPTFAVTTGRRLAGVSVFSRYGGLDNLVRRYGFEYSWRPEDQMTAAPGMDLGVSLLKRVVQFDRSGGTDNYMPPLLFAYSGLDLSTAQVRQLRNAAGTSLGVELSGDGSTQIADVDGDSFPDIFRAEAVAGQTVVRNLGERRDPVTGAVYLLMDQARSANPTGQLLLSAPDRTLTDYDGDGLTDLIRVDTSTRTLRMYGNRSRLDRVDAVPAGFSTSVTRSVSNLPVAVDLAKPTMRQMDVNFDKVSDFIERDPANGIFRCCFALNQGRGPWQSLTVSQPADMSEERLALSFGDQTTGETNPLVHLADMNGDRLQDLVMLKRSGASITITYWPCSGLGRWGAQRDVTFAPGDLIDLTLANVVESDILVQDFTGDGLADVLLHRRSNSSSSMIVRVNLAGRRLSAPHTLTGLPRYSPEDASPTVMRQADLNANGSTDFLYRNTGLGAAWQWLDLLPTGKPNLLVMADNGLGKVVRVEYGTAAEDMIRSSEAGFPWTTKIPIAMPVVRRLRTTCGFDLDGVPDPADGETTDQYVSEFLFRDGFYDGFEREFRGFAFAERRDYGDDFHWDPATRRMVASSGWNPSKTPTGQVSGPTLVTRYQFLTGAADRQDNDVYPDSWTGTRLIDEIFIDGGREEEPLKGRQVLEEKVDPWALHDPSREADFDRGASARILANAPRLTPDAFVYTRARQSWTVRRLYRPDEALSYFADQNADGVPDNGGAPVGTIVPAPPGRFTGTPVLAGSGRSVSYCFASEVVSESIEANGVLQESVLAHPLRSPVVTLSRTDFDDYGNEVRKEEWGIVADLDADGAWNTPAELDQKDDERITTKQIALGGEALDRWIIGQVAVSRTTDENGVFVSESRSYFDGAPFVGLPLGQVGARALAHRSETLVNGADPVPAIGAQSDRPGDPRLLPEKALASSRSAFDRYGNLVVTLDPLARLADITLTTDADGFPTGLLANQGHCRELGWDTTFHQYPVAETIHLGMGLTPLRITVGYDLGFGTITDALDFNGNRTLFGYDSFARLVSIVKPGDTVERPTQVFKYEPADPIRHRIYRYSSGGDLTVIGTGAEIPASRVLTRARENAGTSDQFVAAAYTDGCGRALAKLTEGEAPGLWIVASASNYNRRMAASAAWLPYDISYGANDTELPPFSVLWGESRPPATEFTSGRPILKSDALSDPLGRSVYAINPPETVEALDNEAARTRVLTQNLPFETRLFDAEDTRPGSPRAGTPMVRLTDGLGRLTEVREVVRIADDGAPLASGAAPAEWITRYDYDLLGNLVLITDSQQNRKWMRFDAAGRKIFMNDPDRGTMTFTYDDASNMTSIVDAKGQVTEYAYDGVNRLLSEDYLDAAGLTPDVEYHYDVPAGSVADGHGGAATARNTLGYLSFIRDLSGEEHNSYDARGRVEWVAKRIPDPITGALGTYRTALDYDSLDRIRAMVYPDNDRVTYEYNARNLLDRVSGGVLSNRAGSPWILSDQEYLPSVQLLSCRYGNGEVRVMTYVPRLLTAAIRNVPEGRDPFLFYGYTFDAASNITRIDDLRPAAVRPAGDPMRNTQVFEYDDLYRLTRVQYSFSLPGEELRNDGVIAWRYDRIGNMLEQQSAIVHEQNGLSVAHHGTMSYGGTSGRSGRSGRAASDPPGPHALTSTASGRVMDYDANGNAIFIDGMAATWDFKDRLVALESESMRAEYTYDYSDRRITKKVTKKTARPTLPPLAPEDRPLTTLYIDQHFEVREDAQPVKYVFAGAKRVARITGSLDPDRERTQRFALAPGWNHVALAVEAPVSQLRANGVLACYQHIHGSGTWQTLPSDGFVGSGTVLAVRVAEPMVLAVTGFYDESATLAPLPSGGGYVLRPTLERARLLDAWPSSVSAAWQPDAPWAVRHARDLGGHAGGFLPVGSVLWLETAAPMEAPLETISAAERIHYYHQDHLGSSNVLADAQGNVLEETVYYPFGEPRKEWKSPAAERNLPARYLFTQKERDEESGFQYFEARYLSGVTGRFLRVDPLASNMPEDWLATPQDLNLYAYCGNQPLICVDPSGMDDAPAQTQQPAQDAAPKGGGDQTSAPSCVDVDVTGEAALGHKLGSDELNVKSDYLKLSGTGTVSVCNDGDWQVRSGSVKVEGGLMVSGTAGSKKIGFNATASAKISDKGIETGTRVGGSRSEGALKVQVEKTTSSKKPDPTVQVKACIDSKSKTVAPGPFGTKFSVKGSACVGLPYDKPKDFADRSLASRFIRAAGNAYGQFEREFTSWVMRGGR